MYPGCLPLPEMVLPVELAHESEWGLGAMLVVMQGSGKCFPGITSAGTARLKEYHNCYNTIECQFFNYIREALLALKM